MTTTLDIRPDELRAGDVIVAIDGRSLRAPRTVLRELGPVGLNRVPAVRLVNALGTDTEWNLYPDTQVSRGVTIERPAPPEPSKVPALVTIHTPKGTVSHLAREHTGETLCGRHHGLNPNYVVAGGQYTPAWNGSTEPPVCARCATLATGVRVTRPRVVTRTIDGLRLRSTGDACWETEDGRYVIQRDDDNVTECEGPHPVRFSAALVDWARTRPNRPDAAAILAAARQGRRGYYCEGGAEHAYTTWAAWDRQRDDYALNGQTFETFKDAADNLAAWLRHQDTDA